MLKYKVFVMLMIVAVILSACLLPSAAAPEGQGAPNGQNQSPANQGGGASSNDAQSQPSSSAPVVSDAAHTSDVDLTHLEVGDGKYSTSPQIGYVYSCMTSFNGGGAQGTGNWMNGDGTWDATKKAVIDGSVNWSHSFIVTLQGSERVFVGNDLPNHPTGNYPVSSSDDAYAYDRNPNSIREQSVSFNLPAIPTAANQPNCIGGEVGIMLSGVVIFSAFDSEGRDAAAHEVQDSCDGHPQVSGFYHYHNLSDCFEDTETGHSALMGYAFDGYGIYGYYDIDGTEVTNEDLDVCHGHSHMIEWDEQMIEMYHYHATHEFPYVVGCFHGTPSIRGLSNQGGGQPTSTEQGQPQSGGQPTGGGQGQPPQEAFTACNGLSEGASCSVNTPIGSIAGLCRITPASSQLACVPAGGPPP